MMVEEDLLKSIPSWISDLIAKSEQEGLHKRRRVVGFVPRGQKTLGRRDRKGEDVSCFNAFRRLVSFFQERISSDEYARLCVENLGIKEASAKQSLTTLTHLGLVEQIGLRHFVASNISNGVLGPGQEFVFAIFLHTRYRFVGEILTFLDDPRSAIDLTKDADTTYGLKWPSHDSETRFRLEVLCGAGLIYRRDSQRYHITAYGEKFREILPLEKPAPVLSCSKEVNRPAGILQNSARISTTNLLMDNLRKYSKNPSKSKEFEVCIADSFGFLGFSSIHLGSSASTDVLATAELPPGDRYRISIDAKTSASGTIGENNIRFEALKDHRDKHGADLIIAVGPDFEKRVRKWASEHNVKLVTVDELINLIEVHQKSPIRLSELRVIFESSESISAATDRCISSRTSVIYLASKILAFVNREANIEDPIEGGALTVNYLRFALRDAGFKADVIQIEEAIKILAAPPFEAVVSLDSDHIKLANPPSSVAKHLEAIAHEIREAASLLDPR